MSEKRGLCWYCVHHEDCGFHNRNKNKVIAECHKHIPVSSDLFYQMIAEHFDEVGERVKRKKGEI